MKIAKEIAQEVVCVFPSRGILVNNEDAEVAEAIITPYLAPIREALRDAHDHIGDNALAKVTGLTDKIRDALALMEEE